MALIAGLYVQVGELPLFYDRRRLLQLASDTGVEATDDVFADPPPTTGADYDAYSRLLQFIISACGDIDAGCQQGKRYARADLETMVTAAIGSSDVGVLKRAGVIKQLAADLAFGAMVSGVRGQQSDAVRALAPRYESALEKLEQLYQGSRVFDLTDNIEAGLPSTATIGLRQPRFSKDLRFLGNWPDNGNRPPYWC